ncbi:hypothetical protein Pyn_14181 [Prunus yedoensis var. nudiflora]|uniref:WRC domain-containing protein n=1 Tax=Prunus yedoensis var. nudiflora TaxID=2094558 RepID=A0A314U757_PRUYE|nr:hypothetical protein Pyn_14181 [Prunus yedoensis var. nudiflora]
MDEEGVLPDHLRCGRTDGRQWRCKRRVMDDMKLCEIHYLQGRHRQFREKVPESLKLQRKPKNAPSRDQNHNGVKIRARKVDNLVKLLKRKRSEETLKKSKKRKKKMKLKKSELNLELIRMVLKREVDKRNQTKKKKEVIEEESEDDDDDDHDDLTRDLPNGLMAISSSSSQSPLLRSGNAGSNSSSDGKVGVDMGPAAMRRRCFRSKNIEPMPAGTLQVLPYNVGKLRRGKRKRCHWCQRSGSGVSSCLTKCSSCQKHFFCLGCIKERYFDTQDEVKMACPVCRGTCTCKECSENQSKDAESKDYLGVKNKVEVILHFHYLICMLLPVLKQINQDQKVELEAEAKMTGEKQSEVHIKQAEYSCNEQQCCNKCKASIVDLHRSCPNCSYNLCLSCCRDIFNGSLLGESDGIQQLQEAAVRENSNDNYLYYPTLLEIHGDNVEHFQKHWSKGHPVIVRDVLQTTSDLSWDPVLMFCTYLERSIASYENNQNSHEAIHCLDWCELFQEQFPAHYAEIIRALPLQEYMNPMSGLLNLAARMPQEIPKPDIGPCVYISYGCTEQLVQANAVIKLCYDSYDVVNILAHTSDVPISEEQVSKIRSY